MQFILYPFKFANTPIFQKKWLITPQALANQFSLSGFRNVHGLFNAVLQKIEKTSQYQTPFKGLSISNNELVYLFGMTKNLIKCPIFNH